jgi:hypothetical protein
VVMGSLGAYHLYNREYAIVAFLAATFSTVTLAQLVIVLQDIRDTIYDQTTMMAQDMFGEDEEFDHPDYPIEDDDE